MVAKFWWSNALKDNGIHLVKWTELTKSENLWAKILKSIYFEQSSFWEAKRKRNCSWSWTSLVEGREFLHCAWILGNGKSINILNKNWIPGFRKMCHCVGLNRDTKVSELFLNGEIKWDLEKIRNLFPPEIGRQIVAIPLRQNGGVDKICWSSIYKFLKVKGPKQNNEELAFAVLLAAANVNPKADLNSIS
ncbi:retrotransposon protein, putative, unclassified [Senna tora]|uniref:Retrotransposon protein, putative, unclassified n=1 Tax=Senna tora TaxID=362788 RepID=A0A834WKD8_9FABA|nr:retrotransposon protein, putative, unclassified [Senna tora]